MEDGWHEANGAHPRSHLAMPAYKPSWFLTNKLSPFQCPSYSLSSNNQLFNRSAHRLICPFNKQCQGAWTTANSCVLYTETDMGLIEASTSASLIDNSSSLRQIGCVTIIDTDSRLTMLLWVFDTKWTLADAVNPRYGVQQQLIDGCCGVIGGSCVSKDSWSWLCVERSLALRMIQSKTLLSFYSF